MEIRHLLKYLLWKLEISFGKMIPPGKRIWVKINVLFDFQEKFL